MGSKQGREGSRVSLGRPIVEDRPLETGWEEGGPGVIIRIKNNQVRALGLDLGKRINKESAGLGKKKGKEGSRVSLGSQLSRTGH